MLTIREMLVCPTCHGELEWMDLAIRCSECPGTWPLVEGRPSFSGADHINHEHLSNQLSADIVSALLGERAVLNIGAGGTNSKVENTIELEYQFFKHTDVAGDAHSLPFRSDSFSAAVSCNTFEHLSMPDIAASEIMRVLQPGGRFFMQTAFMQPLHEDPYHFFNMTDNGISTVFSKAGFEVIKKTVPVVMSPVFSMAWQTSDLMYWCDVAGINTDAFADMTVRQLSECWRARQLTPSLLNLAEALPYDIARRQSAGYLFELRKP